MKRVTCILPDNIHRALKVYAVEKDTTLIALIEIAVTNFVNEQAQTKPDYPSE